MIIFLAGLLDVPRQLYEAADIEGANGRQKFRYVTLPMISPVIFFSLVIGVIYGFQYFTEAYVASLAASGHGATTPRRTSARRRDPCCSTRSGCTSRASRLPHGLRVGDGVGAVPDHDGLHAGADPSSRRWVHYQGGGSDSHASRRSPARDTAALRRPGEIDRRPIPPRSAATPVPARGRRATRC